MSHAVIFDGRRMAMEIEGELGHRFARSRGRLGREVRIVSAYDSGHAASRIYTRIKSHFARRVGVEFEGVATGGKNGLEVFRVQAVCESVDGLLVQHPNGSPDYEARLAEMVPGAKDVDGCLEDSPFLPATVASVMSILSRVPDLEPQGLQLVVVGNRGRVGKRLERELRLRYPASVVEGIDADDFDAARLQRADVVVSATGVGSLIEGWMVKEGVVCIDVGSPEPEFDTEALRKARFITPVPGGVGPMTVASLYLNLARAVDLKLGLG